MTKPEHEIPLLNLKRQYEPLYPELMESVEGFLKSGRFILGPDVEILEKELSEFLHVKHALGVSNGTDALLIALRSAGIQPGDKVLTSPFTFFATVSAILAVGAVPVFADIDPTSFCIDPLKVEEVFANEKNIKALIAVHLYGQSAEIDALQVLCRKNAVILIEDAAQAIGAMYKGTKVGGFGDFATFSFYPTKNLGALGDAGLVTTNKTELYERAKMIRVHGAKASYAHDLIGGNFRIDTLQAIFLRKFLPYLNGWTEKRRMIAKRYTDALNVLEQHLVCPSEMKDTYHVYHQYTLRVKNNRRDNLKAYLMERGVGSCVYYPIPCHLQKALSGKINSNNYPVAEQAANEVLSLPIYPELLTNEQNYVIESIVEWTRSISQ